MPEPTAPSKAERQMTLADVERVAEDLQSLTRDLLQYVEESRLEKEGRLHERPDPDQK